MKLFGYDMSIKSFKEKIHGKEILFLIMVIIFILYIGYLYLYR